MLEKSDALEDAGRSILLELLKYSTIRRIVNTYDNAEFKRLDTSVYKPLESKHPPLALHFKRLSAMRNKYDVISGIESKLSGLKTLISHNSEHTKEVYSKAKLIYDLFMPFSIIQMQFYLNIASQIQKTAAEKNIRLEQVMESVWYTDEAKRAALLTRQNAQEYFGTSQRIGREMMELKLVFAGLNNKSRVQNGLTIKEIEELCAAKLNYLTKELDRIFPQNHNLSIQITK